MIYALIGLVDLVFKLYMLVVIVRVVLSWIPHNRFNPIIAFIYQITEPPLMRIRQWVPDMGGLDFSPMILIIAILFLERIIIFLLTL